MLKYVRLIYGEQGEHITKHEMRWSVVPVCVSFLPCSTTQYSVRWFALMWWDHLPILLGCTTTSTARFIGGIWCLYLYFSRFFLARFSFTRDSFSPLFISFSLIMFGSLLLENNWFVILKQLGDTKIVTT